MAAESSAAGSMRKAPSMEWRWVSAGEEEEDSGRGPASVGAVGGFESEDEDRDDDEDGDDDEEEQEEARQRLIWTGPSVDWFDVEGNEVSVAQPLEDYEDGYFLDSSRTTNHTVRPSRGMPLTAVVTASSYPQQGVYADSC